MVFRKIVLISLVMYPLGYQATVDCLWFYYIFRHARFYSQMHIMTRIKHCTHLLTIWCCYGNKELGIFIYFFRYLCVHFIQIYLISFSNITFWCHCDAFLCQYSKTWVNGYVIQSRVFQLMGYISGLWNQFSRL